mmetsp:Transcript_34137/g.59583  ORF Transcript_34137/g.59583 Transcript_34137/m.59583 type:complete len:347 (-) Transcript_34137:2448-3488(-)|eukprot:CAMPEP_0204899690 /NCGR_PEP_ID=MMETSP1397-20131031/1998_1 /ASSEMBLY_ACC=CAM_ASM_000891 /TAXON_ID=49980 /ORGANISM="Climacostomum Climacostomum virens, Strain Stock W-24" /LENGTH=346 /DNA_ID=CAMNT_0052067673 /DNA_START=2065 /DNA_END=3105 /DNA_ORIENTATION=-
MLRQLHRAYFFPGQPQYKLYKESILDKQLHIQPKEWEDPLHETHMLIPGLNARYYAHPVFLYVKRILKRKPEKITAMPLSFIAYHASKHNLHDPKLWNTLEENLQDQQQNLSPRMLFGCLYGFYRSSQGSMLAINSLQHDFAQKAVDQLTVDECHEIVEAAYLNKREDFKAGDFVVEHVMPRVMHFWDKTKHAHVIEHLIKITNALTKFELFDPKVWEQVLKVYLVKRPRTVDYWAPLFEALIHARNAGMERHSGLSLDAALEHFRKLYNEEPDFSWKYDITRQKFYDIHEMIARADQGPQEVTWEYTEPQIAHKLPKWYYDLDIQMEEELKGLFFEYRDLLEKKK